MLARARSWLRLLPLLTYQVYARPTTTDELTSVTPEASRSQELPLDARQVAFTEVTLTSTGYYIWQTTDNHHHGEHGMGPRDTAHNVHRSGRDEHSHNNCHHHCPPPGQTGAKLATKSQPTTHKSQEKRHQYHDLDDLEIAPPAPRQATTVTEFIATRFIVVSTTTTRSVTIVTLTSTNLGIVTLPSTVVETVLKTARSAVLVTSTHTVTITGTPGVGGFAGAGSSADQSSGGLSTQALIGIGVGVGCVVVGISAYGNGPVMPDMVSGRSPGPDSSWTSPSHTRTPSELWSGTAVNSTPRVWSGHSWSTVGYVAGGLHQSAGADAYSHQDGMWYPALYETNHPAGHGLAEAGDQSWRNGGGGLAELDEQTKPSELGSKT
ncbi:uncharacterized protein B0I36DRAFT_398157 [Microdochium trichocladiopsis]|uniref:Uncharacterized protein n=1 Tax=Microdochium trichocladiopsis TaxID=1682393 RepID=A0A9P8XSI7_9PEZI|nr:uncharacterized protein B0I36DRAFT_398157 [Microdochium trichocladiopsis]KAH7014456.1 hypothetical protein B0I36DRAFT_398157 [Microdochium trichocladiopsis]